MSQWLAGIATFFPLLIAGCASGTVIEVRAGKFDRRETPIHADLPLRSHSLGRGRLVRVDDGREVPIQVIIGMHIGPFTLASDAAEWILEEPLPAGAVRRYRMEGSPSGAPEPGAPRVETHEEEDRSLLFRIDGREALRYNIAPMPSPAGVDPVYARGGYIHPVRTPSGRVVTNDFPPNHLHHHGIWSAWTKAEFAGHEVDFWNLGAKKGRVECRGVDLRWSGPVHGGGVFQHRAIDLTAPGAPKSAIEETWTARLWAIRRVHVFDVDVSQTCVGPSPLVLKTHPYGGLGFRGAASWEDKKDCAFLTSEGKTRSDGSGTKARWCVVSGPVDGAPAYVAILCHPSSFRAPQPVRLHPEEPFFCYAPPAEGDFEIAPGKPYAARYRFVAADGPPDPAEIERLWRDFAEPPEVVVR